MVFSKTSHGYYRVSITAHDNHYILTSNNERAFIISRLQDVLSTRLLIATVPPSAQLASCIDLLAFSITRESIELVLFALDEKHVQQLSQSLVTQLAAYQSEYSTSRLAATPSVKTKRLRGPHQALATTLSLHKRHQDWEYDRYSSIGFYLHDRRGDWMRIWRMTRLYENEVSCYYQLLQHPLSISPDAYAFNAPPLAS